MLRSTFFSVGLFVGLWGVALLFVDQIVLRSKEEQAQVQSQPQPQPREQGFRGMFASAPQQQQQQAQPPAPKPKVISLPDWVAFSLMSVGSVTMLYAVALPKKNP